MKVKWGIINSRASPVHQSKTLDSNCDNIQEWTDHFSIHETFNSVWRISVLIPHTNKTRATLLNDEVTSIICSAEFKLWYIQHVHTNFFKTSSPFRLSELMIFSTVHPWYSHTPIYCFPRFTVSPDLPCLFPSPNMHGKSGYDCITLHTMRHTVLWKLSKVQIY